MNALNQETDLLSSVELSNPAYFSFGDEQPATDMCEKFVAFFLGKDIYCIPSRSVLEVVHPLPVAPLPNAPQSIAGIAAFKGEVIAVTNIKRILGLPETSAHGKAKLAILRANAKETQFAIPVDSMHELIAASPSSISADPNDASGLVRLLEHESSVFKMIDPIVLLEKLELSIG